MLCRAVLSRRALVGAGCIFMLCYWLFSKHSNESFFLECSDLQSMHYLDELCSNHSKGLLTGSLCTPLCITKEITFTKCLGHGVKVHVLGAKWKDTMIILKTKHAYSRDVGIDHALRSLPNKEDFDENSYSMTKEKFIEHARYAITYKVPQNTDQDLVTQTLEHVFSECDVGQDSVLWFEETISCWQLLETHEYFLYLLLNGVSATPGVLGACGNMFAVQYAPSEPFLEMHVDWAEVRDWEFRVQLALALLAMIESLENTKLGTMYLCDVQEGNFGIVKKWDGSLVAKTIDMDISYSEDYLTSSAKSEQNNSCTSDYYCSFFSCQVKCDAKTKKCAGALSSSNLWSLCTLMFKPRYPHHPALLLNPPKGIAKQLNQLLDQCSQSDSPYIDWTLLKQLQSLLMFSIGEVLV